MADLDNAYQAPTAQVDDVVAVSAEPGLYVEGGRAVESARGWGWITEGYALFRRQAGMWVVLTLIFFGLLIAMQLVPGIGQLAFTLLMPVFIGGLMAGCQTVDRGGELELAHLFAGFRHNTGQLMLIGVIGVAMTLLAMLPVLVATGFGVLATPSGSSVAALAFGFGVLVAGLISLALLIPINMALWFAPALVILQGHSAPRAISQSFRGCVKNLVPFLLYGVILFVLAMIASIPLGLGWLVLAPIVICSVYAGYRDIFLPR
ncbi:MAG TPA: BPSS1780 family membrane protein [Burkholderiales bacterium]|nr:BPSS1780 family membrane protein [Burkholderiales bacterium]